MAKTKLVARRRMPPLKGPPKLPEMPPRRSIVWKHMIEATAVNNQTD
jgi:hypothetical protein